MAPSLDKYPTSRGLSPRISSASTTPPTAQELLQSPQDTLLDSETSSTIVAKASPEAMAPNKTNTSKRGAGQSGGQPSANTQATHSAGPPPPPAQQPPTPLPAGPGPRVLPVTRRLGYAPSSRAQPLPPARNEREEAHRIEALRNQLRHPYANSDQTLRWHLEREQWDVNRAAESFRDANSGVAPPDHPPLHQAQRGRTLEQSRILGVRTLAVASRTIQARAARNAARQNRAPPAPLVTSHANLVELHRRNNWQSRRVTEEMAERVRNGEHFDDIDQSLMSMRTPVVSVEEQDERLAWFLSITAAMSHYSARIFLQNHQWDIAVAVDAWLARGGLPVITPPVRINNRGRPVPEVSNNGMRDPMIGGAPLVRRNSPIQYAACQPGWSASDGATPPLTRTSSTSAPLTAGYQGSGRRSHTINEDRTPVQVNCPDPSKLCIEVIEGQEYKCTWFTGKGKVDGQSLSFRWDDNNAVSHPDTLEFDWSNPEHVTKLNRWRQEYFRRNTGELIRTVARPFNKYERDYIREKEAIRFEEAFHELAGQDPNDAHRTNPESWDAAEEIFRSNKKRKQLLGISAQVLRDLTADFNATFAGKRFYEKVTVLPDGKTLKTVKEFGQPRPSRTEEAIKTQRLRIAAVCHQFMWKLNNPHGPAANAVDVPSDVDSDLEDWRNPKTVKRGPPDEDGDDDRAQGQPRKRARGTDGDGDDAEESESEEAESEHEI